MTEYDPVEGLYQIKFSQVREKDYIRIVWSLSPYSATDLVVTSPYPYGEHVLESHDSEFNVRTAVTLILLHRPKPELPTNPGSVLTDVHLDSGEVLPRLFLIDQGLWLDPTERPIYAKDIDHFGAVL